MPWNFCLGMFSHLLQQLAAHAHIHHQATHAPQQYDEALQTSCPKKQTKQLLQLFYVFFMFFHTKCLFLPVG
jgi:hypothetical protein